MTFHLPPAMLPMQATANEVAADASGGMIVVVKGLRVHLLGCGKIPPDKLRKELQPANTPTDVVLIVAQLLRIYVSFATRAHYAMVGSDLYVIGVPLRVESVTGTLGLQSYFSDLRGMASPDSSFVEADKAFADVYSQRLALDSGFKLLPSLTDADAVTVDLLGVHTGDSRFHASADFSNSGNRFVGRDILGASARYDDLEANEYTALWRHALGGSPGTISAGSYDEVQSSVSTIARSGIWQLLGHGFRFVQDLPANRVLGTFVEGNASWAGLLYADWTGRSLLQLRGAFARRSSTADPGGIVLFRESYAYVEPGVTYAKLFEYSRSTLNFDFGLALDAGSLVGDRRSTPAGRQLELGRASFKSTWSERGWGNLVLSLAGQLAPHRLPEEMEVVYGGPSILTGFLPGAVVGDSGAIGRLCWESTGYEVSLAEIKLRLYSEYGLARFGSSSSAATPLATRGADAAAGLTLTANKHLTLAADFAQPFSRSHLIDASAPGVYFALTIQN